MMDFSILTIFNGFQCLHYEKKPIAGEKFGNPFIAAEKFSKYSYLHYYKLFTFFHHFHHLHHILHLKLGYIEQVHVEISKFFPMCSIPWCHTIWEILLLLVGSSLFSKKWYPPIKITPLPVGEVTNTEFVHLYGKFGP